MHKLYTFSVMVACTFLLVSFSTNPPDGYTGAPGDNFCVECHSQTNVSQGGTISVEGFPEIITPNETYTLTVINRDTVGTAVRGGFQMTILGPNNTKAGDLSSASASSAISITGGRQYWDHSPAKVYPDSNVVRWTAQWTAPVLDTGSLITWYIAGNIADGNFQNIGDRIVAAQGSGSIIISALEEISTLNPNLFPNPGTDNLTVVMPDGSEPDGVITFFNILGAKVGEYRMNSGQADVSHVVAGLYLIEIKINGRSYFKRWSKM